MVFTQFKKKSFQFQTSAEYVISAVTFTKTASIKGLCSIKNKTMLIQLHCGRPIRSSVLWRREFYNERLVMVMLWLRMLI